MKHICGQCGRAFESPGRKNYCSSGCYQKHRLDENRKYRLHTALCQVCGKEFETSERDRFCSKVCRAAYYKNRRTGNLDAVLHELAAFNEAHGTYISYGRWMRGIRE